MKFYRINVSGEKFFLSEKNILSDSPNVFTNRFREHAKPAVASSRAGKRNGIYENRMAVDRNPEIFRYIHRYLQGYDIIRGEISSIDKYHIVEDAKFYGLKKLQRLLEDKWIEYVPTTLLDCKSQESDDDSVQNPVNWSDSFSWTDSIDVDLDFSQPRKYDIV